MKLKIRVRMDDGSTVDRVVHNVVVGDRVEISDSAGVVFRLDVDTDEIRLWRRFLEWAHVIFVMMCGPALKIDDELVKVGEE